uniref:Uncharacterized protein n=1 Tax=Arundo donax TaxID=35708 RepID=A0A0A9FA50_ARUDO
MTNKTSIILSTKRWFCLPSSTTKLTNILVLRCRPNNNNHACYYVSCGCLTRLPTTNDDSSILNDFLITSDK